MIRSLPVCGRFTLTVPSYEDLAAGLGISFDSQLAALYRPRYNIAPTDPCWVLRMTSGVRELSQADWGLIPRFSKTRDQNKLPINARSETLAQKGTFKDSFERRRCVVVADGFFEWEPPPEGSNAQRQPIWFRPRGGGLLSMGGLWDKWVDPATGLERRTFTIVTTRANSDVEPLHDRMPLLLAASDVDTWLSVPARDQPATVSDDVRALIRPAAPGTLDRVRVSARVNSVKNDDPLCIAPPSAEDLAPRPPKTRAPRKPAQTMPLFAELATPGPTVRARRH